MAFCPNCGAQVDGNFCGSCGATMNAGGAPGGQPQQPYTQQQQYQQPQAAGLQQNVACALCYLAGLITGIIFLLIAPYNTDPKVKYHAWQAIGFHVGIIICWVGLTIVTAATGGLLGLLLFPLFGLATFGLWLFLMFKAYQGEGLHLPVIGDFARKQAGM